MSLCQPFEAPPCRSFTLLKLSLCPGWLWKTHAGHLAAGVRAGAERAQVREFLEKHYEEAAGTAAVKLAIRALMETVEASSKSIEIAVMEREAGGNPKSLN